MRFAALAQNEGFSLAETALSLAILALVIGALVPGLLAFRNSEQARATQIRLEAVMRASAGFVQSNGCFPCPAPLSSQDTAGRGVVRGDISANPAACSACLASSSVGLVPFRSLGLSESFARDGYGHWLTFAVDTALAASGLSDIACKAVDSDCTADDVAHSNHKKGLCKIAHSSASSLSVVPPAGGTQTVAIVVLSHGPNGRGAFTETNATVTHYRFPPTSVQPACAVGSAGAEPCNGDGDKVFVAALPGGGSDPFDDQMLYFSRDGLLAAAGGPPCNTVW